MHWQSGSTQRLARGTQEQLEKPTLVAFWVSCLAVPVAFNTPATQHRGLVEKLEIIYLC